MSLLRAFLGPKRSRPLVDAVAQRHPNLREAVQADLELALMQRGDPVEIDSTPTLVAAAIRLALVADGFAGLLFYRVKAAAQRRGIPFVPVIAHRLAIATSQVCIGDPVLVQPGVLVPHGQIVIDGFTNIGAGCRLRPFVTIGLLDGDISGPTIGEKVSIGTGAKVLGNVRVGEGARIGANAVVLADVDPGSAVVGMPARPVGTD